MEDWAPGQHMPWWEIDWDDMPYAAQRAFETLGWTSKSWDPDDPTPCPESDGLPWAELNSVQLEAAAILGFDETEWDTEPIGTGRELNWTGDDDEDEQGPTTRGIKMPQKSGGLFACCMGKKAAPVKGKVEEEDEEEEEEEE
jgi:hypothetical protein